MNGKNMEQKIDKALAVNLYKQGARSQKELADMFGVTKEAIHQMLRHEMSLKEIVEAKKIYKYKKALKEANKILEDES